MSLSDLNLRTLEDTALAPSALSGKVVLFVNVASKCGLTPQYSGLVELYHQRREGGFLVVGVPCNQFAGQEPGTPDAIQSFCSTTYGVDFPLLEKQDVNGPQRSPLYQWLVGDGDDIKWNFGKFVVGPDGEVKGRFSPQTAPDAPELIALVDSLMGSPS
jgi:glutathione peroxidase